MSAEAEFVESPLAVQKPAAAEAGSSQERSPSPPPKRQRLDDSDVHSSDLPSSHLSEGDEVSAASSNDEPITQSSQSSSHADDMPLYAHEDDGLQEVLKRALSNLRGALSRNAAQFEHAYVFYPTTDDDLQKDFADWVIENMINWEKFEPTREHKSSEDQE